LLLAVLCLQRHGSRSMVYLSYTPRPPLNEYVERMWLVAGGQSPRRERILPSGTIELVINLRQDQVRIERTMDSARVQTYSGVVVSGTYSGAFEIDAMQHAAFMGVHFKPAGASAVIGVPAIEYANQHVDLAALWDDRTVSGLRERLCAATTHRARFQHLESALIRRLRTDRRLHPAVRLALGYFGPHGTGNAVGDVARRSGLSHRRFLTIFKSEVGLAPKQFCRILRFQHVHAVTQHTGRVDWAEVALSCGFYDQPHLAHEFRRLSGLTPAQYERAIKETHNLLAGHVAIP
jgi:AraC-like DNA-binding protein